MNAKLSKNNAVFVAIVFIAGTVLTSIPTSFAQPYYKDPYSDAYATDPYAPDTYAKDDRKKGADVNIQKIKCINENTNVNGIEITQTPENGNTGTESQALENGPTDPNGNSLLNGDEINFNKNLVNVCVNVNVNEQFAEDEEPTTGSLTVKKEIFGCDNITKTLGHIVMECIKLQNDSPDWLSCDDATISNTDFCQALQENFFDIEVLDDQNNQVQQFQGSQQGTTVQNLEPGTYTVNEIKHPLGSGSDQLEEHPNIQFGCNIKGFPEGGYLDNPPVEYSAICFEYEDEQGNDCTSNTIAAGEDKTCIVKNYISLGKIL